MNKIIEVNEFGTKRTDNRLCLICTKYIFKSNWVRHIKNKHPKVYNEKTKMEARV